MITLQITIVKQLARCQDAWKSRGSKKINISFVLFKFVSCCSGGLVPRKSFNLGKFLLNTDLFQQLCQFSLTIKMECII